MSGSVSPEPMRRFRHVPKFFYQGDSAVDETNFDYTKYNMGLKTLHTGADHETQWETFTRLVKRMNLLSSKDVQYKVFYLSCYATDNAISRNEKSKSHIYMSQSPIPHTSTPPVPVEFHSFLTNQITYERMPLPHTFYTSPSRAAQQTVQSIYSTLPFPMGRKLQPINHELLREAEELAAPSGQHNPLLAHNIDHSEADDFDFDECFMENGDEGDDVLESQDVLETQGDKEQRVQMLLDDIFGNDESTFISITCHPRLVTALLRAVGHRDFKVAAGTVLPVLIKAE